MTDADPWSGLRPLTRARVGLGRVGDSLPTRDVLDFQLAHARARDAVHAGLDAEALREQLRPAPVIEVRSAAPDRPTYLRRPDLGRRLDPGCHARLTATGADVAFVIADGLSAVAVRRHAAALLTACVPLLHGLTMAPVVIAHQARVALGDEVGERLGVRACVVLIGERPGLSVPDSLGAYLTFAPCEGRKDSERNCISNIHTGGGLGYEAAAAKLAWLIRQALRLGLTGVGLKDAAPALGAPPPTLSLPPH